MTISRMHTSARASHIVIHGGTVYLSGQVAENPEADVQEQTRSTLGRVDALLAEAGTDAAYMPSQPQVVYRTTAPDNADKTAYELRVFASLPIGAG